MSFDKNAEWARFTPEGHAITQLFEEIERLKKRVAKLENRDVNPDTRSDDEYIFMSS